MTMEIDVEKERRALLETLNIIFSQHPTMTKDDYILYQQITIGELRAEISRLKAENKE